MSGVSFQHIPSNLRVPLFYAEMDASQANFGTQPLNALLIGQMLPFGTATPNQPILLADPKSAATLFGTGSMLARMVSSYRNQDAGSCNLWCLPLLDDAAAAPAMGTITVSGTALAAGSIALYIAGQRVSVGVYVGDDAPTIAAAIIAAINASSEVPVTAAAPAVNVALNAVGIGARANAIAPSDESASSETVFLTSLWAGQTANDITVLDSFLGWTAGEKLPPGVSLTYSAATLAGGSGDPSIAVNAIPGMGDDPYDFIIHPYAQAQALDDLQLELNDATGRWSYARQLYGHAYTALRGGLSDLVAFGSTRNDQHHTVASIDADCPIRAGSTSQPTAEPTQSTSLQTRLGRRRPRRCTACWRRA